MNRNILEVLGVTAKPQKQGASSYQMLDLLACPKQSAYPYEFYTSTT